MRRIVALASLATLLVVLLPGSAAAAPATKASASRVTIECEATTDDGFVFLFVTTSSQPGESFADMAFWANGLEPFDDQPTLFVGDSTANGDATHLSATFDLLTIDESQDPPEVAAGSATFEADLSPSGDPQPIDQRERDGNRWIRVTGTSTPLVADGALVLPGADLTDLSGCFASSDQFRTFVTNPSSRNDGFTTTFLRCDWDIDDETGAHLQIQRDEFGAFGDVNVSGPDIELHGGTEATFTDTAAALDVELTDDATGDPGGSASAAATLASTGTRVRTVDSGKRGPTKIFDEPFSVDGTFDLTIGSETTSYPMDDDHCFAATRRVIIHEVHPNGPKPGPIANDTPETAAAARLGRTTRIVTGGNAPDGEAPCTVVDPVTDQETPVPIGFTAWYTVKGTGASMTVDTTNSDFDTVAAVYTSGPSGLEQVICVDDVLAPDFQLQAKATWASVAGTTYYLQLGGYGNSAGHLESMVK